MTTEQRVAAREAAMKLLYEAEVGGGRGEDTLERLMEYRPTPNETAYIDGALAAVRGHTPFLDKLIAEHAEGWALERIAKVDLCILRLALAEMLVMRDKNIPTAVSINEAVELAKRFSTPDSYSFINGILGSVARSECKT